MENDSLQQTKIVVEAEGLAELSQLFSEQVKSVAEVKVALATFQDKVVTAAKVRFAKCTSDAPNLNLTFQFSPPNPTSTSSPPSE